MLKSDHFGIEIPVPGLARRQATLLKSDHFGIEMMKISRQGQEYY